MAKQRLCQHLSWPSSYVLVGTFSCVKKKKKNDQRKAGERELATFDENRRAVGMLNPMRDKNDGT